MASPAEVLYLAVTASVASAEGCKRLLAPLLDHILNLAPIELMRQVFKTEVHGVQGDGSDDGVVWSGAPYSQLQRSHKTLTPLATQR